LAAIVILLPSSFAINEPLNNVVSVMKLLDNIFEAESRVFDPEVFTEKRDKLKNLII